MTDFYLELIGVVNETFKESLDRRMKEAEADPLDGEDRIRSYICIDVEEAIRVKLKEKYQEAAIEYDKKTLKAMKELARKEAAQT